MHQNDAGDDQKEPITTVNPAKAPMQSLCLLPLLPALLLPGLGALIALAIVITVLVFVRASRGPTLALRDRGIGVSVAIGIASGLGVVVAFGVVLEPIIEQVTSSRVDLGALAGVEGDFPAFLMLLAFGLLFGGIVEEVIFRGYVVGWGTALFGARAAPWLVVLSAVVFGVSHLYQGVAGMLATGLVGFAFGLLYLGTNRRLLPVIVAHMTVNAYGITMLYLGFG